MIDTFHLGLIESFQIRGIDRQANHLILTNSICLLLRSNCQQFQPIRIVDEMFICEIARRYLLLLLLLLSRRRYPSNLIAYAQNGISIRLSPWAVAGVEEKCDSGRNNFFPSVCSANWNNIKARIRTRVAYTVVFCLIWRFADERINNNGTVEGPAYYRRAPIVAGFSDTQNLF